MVKAEFGNGSAFISLRLQNILNTEMNLNRGACGLTGNPECLIRDALFRDEGWANKKVVLASPHDSAYCTS